MTSAISLLIAEGEKWMSAGNLVGAREAFQEAVTLAERNHGVEAPEIVLPLWWLAKAYRAHKYEPCAEIERAIAAESRAIMVVETMSPRNEPLLASLLTFHGISLWLNQRLDDAVATLGRAADLIRQWSRDTREQVGAITEILLMSAGLPGAALPYAREFVRLEEDLRPDGATNHSRYLLCDCLRKIGPRDEARAALQDLLEKSSDRSNGDPELYKIVQGWLKDLDASETS